jgi:hypothetical protein
MSDEITFILCLPGLPRLLLLSLSSARAGSLVIRLVMVDQGTALPLRTSWDGLVFNICQSECGSYLFNVWVSFLEYFYNFQSFREKVVCKIEEGEAFKGGENAGDFQPVGDQIV